MRNRSMSTPEHTLLSMMLENIAAVVTGVTLILLASLKYLGKGKQAEIAKAVLIETPVSHAELLECRIEAEKSMRAIIKEEFKGLKKDFIDEIRILHKKQNTHIKDYHSKRDY